GPEVLSVCQGGRRTAPARKRPHCRPSGASPAPRAMRACVVPPMSVPSRLACSVRSNASLPRSIEPRARRRLPAHTPSRPYRLLKQALQTAAQVRMRVIDQGSELQAMMQHAFLLALTEIGKQLDQSIRIIRAQPAPATAAQQVCSCVRTIAVYVEDGAIDPEIFEELGRGPYRLLPVAEVDQHIRLLQHPLHLLVWQHAEYAQLLADVRGHHRCITGWR